MVGENLCFVSWYSHTKDANTRRGWRVNGKSYEPEVMGYPVLAKSFALFDARDIKNHYKLADGEIIDYVSKEGASITVMKNATSGAIEMASHNPEVILKTATRIGLPVEKLEKILGVK